MRTLTHAHIPTSRTKAISRNQARASLRVPGLKIESQSIQKTTIELNLIRYPIVYISKERAFHKLQTLQFVTQNIKAV